ncbi:hypothetical protein J1N35_024942 [Gossypium stocksii]|uniref:Aminotransferase-like plant mobile domain-containing protein n=1 Tax=Gossypium stocksii TaxID=47602 RepID=A0A9D3V5N4_9ROSI|nr:hypothetical protein J1N35_024942 [Gossypium stocksii]
MLLTVQFIWMPYSVPEVTAVIPSYAHVHSHLWCISAPLIHFQTVEWYHGDRVLRQFCCTQYISTLPVRLDAKLHGMTRRGRHGIDWGDEHAEYITMWKNRFGRIPQMDRSLDLRPSTQYVQWYYENGKPFLFGGRSLVVPPYMTRIGQHSPCPHHALALEPKPELEPEQHSGSSSYYPDLGAIAISRALQSLISSAHHRTPLLPAHIHHRTLLLQSRIHRRSLLPPTHIHLRSLLPQLEFIDSV